MKLVKKIEWNWMVSQTVEMRGDVILTQCPIFGLLSTSGLINAAKSIAWTHLTRVHYPKDQEYR